MFPVALLEFIEVCKRYLDGEREMAVLDRVSLVVEDGDFVGIRGRRRSGKSTLLEVAAGLVPVDSGRVLVCGCDLGALGMEARVRFLRGRVGLASADWRSHRRMPLLEYLATPLWSAGTMSARAARGRALAVLERVDLLSSGDASTDELSLAEAVRATLARALVAGPSLLLVDEPPVLRSPSEGMALYELLKDLGEEPGLAVILASEDLELIQKAHRIARIGGGQFRWMSQPGVVSSLEFAKRARRQVRNIPDSWND